MKKIVVFAAALLSSANLFSQKIKVDESSESLGGGSNNAFVVTIYDAKPDDIEREWRSMMKDWNAKTDKKDGGVFGDNAKIAAINGNNTIDIYAKAEQKKDNEVKFMVAFDLGGAFLSSSKQGSEAKEAKKIVYDFAVKMTKEAIAGQLKAAEKILEKKNDERKDLEKDKEKLEKNIAEWKEKIKKAEDDIVKNKSDQETKKGEIEVQKKVVEEIQKKEKAVD